MKVLAIIIAFIITTSANVRSDESFQALFEKANRHYEAGEYSNAQDLYLSMVRQGCINDKVFYNLGNTFLKLQDIGKSILYFRRGQLLAPRDKDLSFNLELARSLVKSRIKAVQKGIFGIIIDFPVRTMTTRETAALFIFVYLALIGTSLAAHLAPRKRTQRRLVKVTATMLIFFLASSYALGARFYALEISEEAVALAGNVIARSGPGDHFKEVFQQEAGYEMKILRIEAGWVEVVLGNGYSGWVPESSIERI